MLGVGCVHVSAKCVNSRRNFFLKKKEAHEWLSIFCFLKKKISDVNREENGVTQVLCCAVREQIKRHGAGVAAPRSHTSDERKTLSSSSSLSPSLVEKEKERKGGSFGCCAPPPPLHAPCLLASRRGIAIVHPFSS
jgi:hypothetical protein